MQFIVIFKKLQGLMKMSWQAFFAHQTLALAWPSLVRTLICSFNINLIGKLFESQKACQSDLLKFKLNSIWTWLKPAKSKREKNILVLGASHKLCNTVLTYFDPTLLRNTFLPYLLKTFDEV